jgi:hypothetical protein
MKKLDRNKDLFKIKLNNNLRQGVKLRTNSCSNKFKTFFIVR